MTDVIIVGGGPAGLSAAIEARRHGASVLLLDEGMGPGGRIWQAAERREPRTADERLARQTIADFRASGAEARFRAAVWAIEPAAGGMSVFWSEGGVAQSATAPSVVLATGTTERPVPIPGWTLPGVMNLGAGQILLKTAGLVPQGASWIAGQGPLLLLYAVQVLNAGGRIAGILELAPRGKAGGLWAGALPVAGMLAKGAWWRARIAMAGIPWIKARDLRAEGDGRLERIRFTVGGRARSEAADTLLLHDGVIPSVQISRALRCDHAWHAAQGCWRPVVDDFGASSVPGVWIAGDGAGIAGWEAATLSGRLAALDAVMRAGRLNPVARNEAAARLMVRRRMLLGLRPLLDALYPPLNLALADDTVVCRCEEVTAGRLREAGRIGCLGLNQVKAFTRAGMGPCQGRMCAPTTARILAEVQGMPVEDVAPLRTRFPTKPLTVGELAALHG